MGTLGPAVALVAVALGTGTQQPLDPIALIREADRLAWLRAWTNAGPLYEQAERLFAARGDQHDALYARVSYLRGQLPRLSLPEASARLVEYLDDPLVRADDRLRLRCLVIKGEIEEDLDPSLAAQSWREAEALAEKLGEPGWANRARRELGLGAFLQGDIGGSVTALGQALKVATATASISERLQLVCLRRRFITQRERAFGFDANRGYRSL